MPADQVPINLTIRLIKCRSSSPNGSSNSIRNFFQHDTTRHDTVKMGRYAGGGLLFLLLSLVPRLRADSRVDQMIRSPSDFGANQINGREDDDSVGTRWAVLIAGSSEYGNYMHQSVVHHALNPDQYRGVFGSDGEKYAKDVQEIILELLGELLALFLKPYSEISADIKRLFSVVLVSSLLIWHIKKFLLDDLYSNHVRVQYGTVRRASFE